MMRYVRLVRHLANWPLYFRYKLWGGDGPLTFHTRAGITIEVPPLIMHDFKDVFFAGCYVDGMERPISPGSTVIDIGANIGSFTFYAADQFPGARVLAFEPDPTNFAQLTRNASFNPGRAEIHRMAVADVTGEAMLTGGKADGYSTGASIVADAAAPAGHGVAVPTISLADLFERFGVAHCALLKLDCEGAEFPILQAAPDWVLARVDQMIMEVHTAASEGPLSRAGLAAALNERGFRTAITRAGLLRAWR